MRSIRELTNLQGRVALITGGGGHIGRVVAGALAEVGADVAVADLDENACRAAAAEIAETHKTRAVALVADLAVEREARAVVSTAIQSLGGLDIIVHCAAWVGTTQAAGWAVPFRDQSVASWDAAIRVNLTSAFVVVQQAATALAARGGSVILVSSIYGLGGPDMRLYEGTPMAHPAAYGVSKAGLIQLSRYLATVLAPSIRVNTISPGGVERGQASAFRDRYRARTPLARMATEEDLKGATVFLASDLSAYVTGQNLVVDGGWTTW